MSIKRILDDRTVSSFGISIGTGIALESLFDPTTERYDVDRKVPNDINPETYKVHYYNIFTLARNIVTAVHSNNYYKVMDGPTLMEVLLNEISVIASLYDNLKCEPVLFIPDYSSLYKKMNISKTGNIVNKDYDLRNFIYSELKKHPIEVPMKVLYGTYKLKPTSNSVLILTHIPSDLLNINKIKKLSLLESHTGKLKTRHDFYTKFHKIGSLDMGHFPYIEELLYVLGDKNFILPFKLTIRRELHNLALDKKWTSFTSKLIVLQDLKNNDVIGPLLKNYKRSY